MYNIKIYESNWTTLKKTIEIEKLESISSFSCQSSWGFSDIKISIAYKITNTEVSNDNIIKVQYWSREIYVWYIVNIQRLFTANKEVIQFTAVWLCSLLKWVLTTNVYNDTASNIVKSLIDDFNVEYGSNILSYDVLSVPDSQWIISIDFSSYTSYFDAITDISEVTWLTFFIDKWWKLFFKDKSLFNNHILTVWLDVDSLTIDENAKSKINTLILKYDWWLKTYQNSVVINKKEKYIDVSSTIKDETTADIYWDSFLEQNQEKKKISIVLNNQYSFFDILWWDLIDVKNTWYVISWLQVAKVTYTIETATIELEESDSFAQEVFNF